MLLVKVFLFCGWAFPMELFLGDDDKSFLDGVTIPFLVSLEEEPYIL